MTQPLSLYIHWPWCVAKCPYCDFNSHAGGDLDAAAQARWRAAYLKTLATWRAETGPRPVETVFFGGGTPSLMDPDTVAAVIAEIDTLWPAAPDREVTLEANPGTAEAGRFASLREAGVDRLSLGVQSFDDAALRFLGRVHSAGEARAALALARETFPRVSFDLIYALPGQDAAAWRAQMTEALAYAPDHLSAYQLTVEKGTAFHREQVAEAPEDAAVALYGLTQEVLGAAGLPAYEVSNHARPGAECRHNLLTWQGGDYVGVGPGAHGRLSRDGTAMATLETRDPARWLALAEAGDDRRVKRTPLSPVERREELLLLGLRLSRGIGRDRFRTLTGREIEAAVDVEALERLAEDGFVTVDAAGLRTTAQGRLMLNAVVAALAAR